MQEHKEKNGDLAQENAGNFIINPLNREDLVDFLDDKAIEIIRYFIIKSLFSQPESKVGQNSLPIQIPKEHIEQWFTQALDVEPVGAGSYPVDIYNEREHWGADIKMLNIKVDSNGAVKNGDSGEASLGQKFIDIGTSLDELFVARNYEEIKNKWVLLYKEKYKALKKDYPLIKKIYYFFILRPGIQAGGTDFYFTGAVLNLENLDSVLVNNARSTANSVFLDNFISDYYGNTKIYKAKKRLELRLCPKNWINNDKALRIKTSFIPSNINLREKEVGIEYLEEQIKKLRDIEVRFIV